MKKVAPCVPPLNFDTRRDQIFPVLDTDEIERARRFGDVRRFSTGEALASVGEIGEGLAIILEGHRGVSLCGRGERRSVRVHGRIGPARRSAILRRRHRRGTLKQLSARPHAGFANRRSRKRTPDAAPIPRRAAVGPVIVGRAEPDAPRLEHFLARNGTPRMTSIPETDPEAT